MILKDTDKKSVKINMITVSDSEKAEFCYDGYFQIKNGKKYLIYSDENEKCSLVGDGQAFRISKLKSGGTMVFEKDAEHICSYSTPMGNIPLCVAATAVEDKLCENGTLLLEYGLSVPDTEPIKNKITITIEEI